MVNNVAQMAVREILEELSREEVHEIRIGINLIYDGFVAGLCHQDGPYSQGDGKLFDMLLKYTPKEDRRKIAALLLKCWRDLVATQRQDIQEKISTRVGEMKEHFAKQKKQK